MAAECVILRTCPESRLEPAVLGAAYCPVMLNDFVGERPGFPAFHPRRQDCNVIDTAVPYRHVSANVFETLPPEQLAATRYVFNTHESIIVSRPGGFLERSSNQSQLAVRDQLT